jgi:hypothetical protein
MLDVNITSDNTEYDKKQCLRLIAGHRMMTMNLLNMDNYRKNEKDGYRN